VRKADSAWPGAFRPSTGLESVPTVGGNPLLQMLLRGFAATTAASAGMQPLNMNFESIFQQLQQQAMTQNNAVLMRELAQADQLNAIRLGAGFMRLTGHAVGSDLGFWCSWECFCIRALYAPGKQAMD